MPPRTEEPFLMELIQAIVSGDTSQITKLLAAYPHLVHVGLATDAIRGEPNTHFFMEIEHQVYVGDTGLHVAAAALNLDIAANLVTKGADLGAKNRHGAQALHYASDSGPMKRIWNPEAQEKVIAFLIKSGSNPNAVDKRGVSPLHRAVRTRSADAVRALLAGGAEVRIKNDNGSTPLHLAVQNTGRGGSGSPACKAHQMSIIQLLLISGADPEDKDSQGKTVRQWINEEWIGKLLP
jgi:ankyrin repeat protein